ncbi:hypothetical protein PVAND_000135 [Polypedilum vanderplanki]|uniref:Uncharacterized protein n=1 Tax=Polypedilum vanderplanki TaxID=319348 RepID=A0A9J6BJ38_POLVA|nr:hypothetical protein PVAND_000135 [Polypedilum vanderplanki]
MCESENDIVISGISGRFPKSNNVHELAENLYNKIDMTCDKEDRWKHVYPKVSPRFGKISNIEKFDAPFFAMLNKQAKWTDPQMRMLLEHSYEAILDAGISPQSLMGSKTAVIVGAISSDSRDYFCKNITPTYDGFRIIGHGNCHLANRISYLFGLHGPSLVLDTACSSSASALDVAYHYIKSGVCDAALVGGIQLNLNILIFSEYNGLGILASDGVSRPFDENVSGFCRAESICAVFLQKRKDSKRIYAQFVHSLSSNDGFKTEGQWLPSRDEQVRLMNEFYNQIDVDKKDIKFIEAHATGTFKGDIQEVTAVDEVFCKNHDDPLIIGTVKSNMGHTEAASGVVSLTKIVIAFENGNFPPNINLTNKRSDIEAFNDGRIQVATDAVPIDSDYIALNSFGLGGSNVHALFKRNPKIKINNGLPKDSLERIVLWSGRTEEALNTIFDDIVSRPLDAEYIALLHNTQIMTSDANTYRGFGIFKKNNFDNAICIQRSMKLFDGIRRKIVFLYTGMGTQWHEMGCGLMEIPIFAESIEKCHKILAEKCDNFDLKALFESDDKNKYNDIKNSYLGIISIEIALTDLLNALEIKPTFIIGHSVGEIGCAYADGCLSAEEALLIAFKRAKVNQEANIMKGAMAAIGMHYKELEPILPAEIDIACHNSHESTTISGPKESVLEFINKMTKDGIFAKEVACAGIPFHSRYISKVSDEMYKNFSEILKNPKRRSPKWISSSFPEDRWDEDEVKICGSQYHVANALNPVLFEEAALKLPKNSIVIEISPNGILNSIVKSLLKKSSYVALAQKSENAKQQTFEAIGNLFQYGIDMNAAGIYPAIQFPVYRGTQMISPKIKWNHNENHFVGYFDSKFELERFSTIINFDSEEYSFLKDHIIDGKLILAGASYLVFIWKLFALMNSADFEKFKVTFKDIEMLRATRVLSNKEVSISISIQRNTGHFDLSEGNMTIIKGIIFHDDNLKIERVEPYELNEGATKLQREDFYKHARIRGYQYRKAFQTIKEISFDGKFGKIQWKDNWTTFIDALLQTPILEDENKDIGVPYKINEISIDPIMHLEMVKEQKEEILFEFEACTATNRSTCGGVVISGLRGATIPRQQQKKPLFESYKFIPYISNDLMRLTDFDILKIFFTTFCENYSKFEITVVEINDKNEGHAISHLLKIMQEFLNKTNLKLLTSSKVEIKNVDVTIDEDLKTFVNRNSNANIVIKDNCLNDCEFLQMINTSMTENVVFISKEDSNCIINNENLKVISKIHTVDNFTFIMFQHKSLNINEHQTTYKCIKITPNPSDWLENLQKIVQDVENNEQIVIYSQNTKSGILGFYNCLRFELGVNKKMICVLIDDENAPKFDPNDSFYSNQLKRGLTINVLKDGKWGALRHFNITRDLNHKPQTGHCFANYSRSGNLSSIKWRQGDLNNKLSEKSDDLIAIYYSSLNFKDILYAHGYIKDSTNLSRECAIGFEFSGIHLKTGKRVMGVSNKTGCISTLYDISDAYLFNVPENWSLEEAATFPSAYATVYYSFFKATKIQKGQSILIHCGAGGVGQAALNVAFAYGLEVFTTVGTDEKREFLLKNFPQLKSENIGNSRDTSFLRMIMKQTNKKGVDYVLNSLSGEKLMKSIECLKKGGVFLEIGRADIIKGTTINLDFLGKDIELKSIRVDQLQENGEDFKDLLKLMGESLETGIMKPLNYTIFDAADVKKAFQFMASGNHIGKILLKIRESNDQSLPLNVLPRFYCDPECSYIVVGGLGGLGLEFSQWLVTRGCRKLVLSSSRGISNQYQNFKINFWKKYGVETIVSTSNIITIEGCNELIQTALQLGKVDGIFNFAVILHDRIFVNHALEMFNKSLAPKAIATKHLHDASIELCPDLKHFVAISSVSCGRGFGGQTNYGMSNSVMEEVVNMRFKMKLPAKAIQWGPVADVGLLSDVENPTIYFYDFQSITSILESLDTLLLHPDAIVGCVVLADKFDESNKQMGLIDMLMKLLNIEDRKSISMNSNFSQLGIDSLVGIEMQQLIEREYGLTLTAKEIRTLSLAELEMRFNTKNENTVKK